jgi:hypothetical protein
MEVFAFGVVFIIVVFVVASTVRAEGKPWSEILTKQVLISKIPFVFLHAPCFGNRGSCAGTAGW